MSWTSGIPIGTLSVKNNRPYLRDNFNYIEATMGKSIVGTNTNTTRDHFWAVDTTLDGRHRFIQAPMFTSTAPAPDDVNPALGAGMNTVLFPKTTTGGVQWFHKNVISNNDQSNYIYQVTPHHTIGQFTVSSTSTWVTILTLPANVYGEIFMFDDLNVSRMATGTFASSSTETRGYSTKVKSNGSTNFEFAIELRNDTTGSLDLQARLGHPDLVGTWHYRLIYRKT